MQNQSCLVWFWKIYLNTKYTLCQTSDKKGIRKHHLSIKVRGWKWWETSAWHWHVQLIWFHWWSCWEGFRNSKSHIQEAKPEWPSNKHFIVLKDQKTMLTDPRKVKEKRMCWMKKLQWCFYWKDIKSVVVKYGRYHCCLTGVKMQS